MLDPKRLLDQLLGSEFGANAGSAARGFTERLDGMSGSKGFASGAVAGGLLGLLLGGNKRRRLGGGFMGYGGAAVIGALALQAYQNYQRQQSGAPPTTHVDPTTLPHLRPSADGTPFELTLVRAMVGAAKADGHIDAAEQRRLFAEVERLGLDADAKAYVLDLLTHDIDLDSLAGAVSTPEQGAELYLAARLAIDADEPAERAYLDALGSRLRLPAELRAALDSAPQTPSA